MLYIIEHNKARTLGSEWHVGEPAPKFLPDTRVVTFQADGDELELLKLALGKRDPGAICG